MLLKNSGSNAFRAEAAFLFVVVPSCFDELLTGGKLLADRLFALGRYV
jgi:hypothetical protein